MPMLSIDSVDSLSYRGVLQNRTAQVISLYGRQALTHVELIEVGGKRRFGSRQRDGAELMHLVVDLQQPADWRAKWQIVPPVDLQAIEAANRAHVDANQDRWLTRVQDLHLLTDVEGLYIIDWSVDAERFGLYAIYNGEQQLLHLVPVANHQDLFDLFDRARTKARNWTREDLVDLGYLTKADHTSWLGAKGQHVHAVVAYFRQLPGTDTLVYFSLDTWCSGNHWSSREHSPKPVYPNAEHVTCSKCLRKIAKITAGA